MKRLTRKSTDQELINVAQLLSAIIEKGRIKRDVKALSEYLNDEQVSEAMTDDKYFGKILIDADQHIRDGYYVSNLNQPTQVSTGLF